MLAFAREGFTHFQRLNSSRLIGVLTSVRYAAVPCWLAIG